MSVQMKHLHHHLHHRQMVCICDLGLTAFNSRRFTLQSLIHRISISFRCVSRPVAYYMYIEFFLDLTCRKYDLE